MCEVTALGCNNFPQNVTNACIWLMGRNHRPHEKVLSLFVCFYFSHIWDSVRNPRLLWTAAERCLLFALWLKFPPSVRLEARFPVLSLPPSSFVPISAHLLCTIIWRSGFIGSAVTWCGAKTTNWMKDLSSEHLAQSLRHCRCLTANSHQSTLVTAGAVEGQPPWHLYRQPVRGRVPCPQVKPPGIDACTIQSKR